MELSPGAAYLLDRLHESGYGAWLVGGCVRDSLRGVVPHDFDLATTALPQQVMACFPDFPVLPTGMRHGTVTVVADGALLEVTTLRADGVYRDGRRPQSVDFVGDIQADLARRDFTVNAMAWNVEDGLIDPFGGREDLERGLLRCVGDPMARLGEDALRIMRCLRFAACLGYAIDRDTAAALYNRREGLAGVAAERLNRELSLLVCGEWAAKVIFCYKNILCVIIPEISTDIRQKLLDSAGDDRALRLALLLQRDQPHRVLRRLRFDGATIREVSVLVALLQGPLPTDRATAARLTSATGAGHLAKLVPLWRACGEHGPEQTARNCQAAAEAVEQVLNCGCYTREQLAIDGNTLVDIGLRPGPELGKLLGELWVAVMAGHCPNRPRDLTQLARQLYRSGKI